MTKTSIILACSHVSCHHSTMAVVVVETKLRTCEGQMNLVLIVTFTFEFKGLYDCLLPAQAKCLAFSPGAYGKLMQSIELPMVASIPPPTT